MIQMSLNNWEEQQTNKLFILLFTQFLKHSIINNPFSVWEVFILYVAWFISLQYDCNNKLS